MRPDRGELAEAIRIAIGNRPLLIPGPPGLVDPDEIAAVIISAWPDPGPMSVDEAIVYAERLTAELGRALAFVRDGLMSDDDPAVSGRLHQSPLCWCEDGAHTTAKIAARLSGLHYGGECWCRQVHSVAGARSLNRAHP